MRLPRPIVVRPETIDVRLQHGASADPHRWADHAVGADLDVVGQIGARVDQRCRVDLLH